MTATRVQTTVLAPSPAAPRMSAAAAALARGEIVVLLDSADAAQTHLVCAAELSTTDQMSFLVQHGSGFVQVAMDRLDAIRLRLPLQSYDVTDFGIAQQTVTVDAAEGISTGISAHDRSTTVRILASSGSTTTDLIRPGHVVPLSVDRTVESSGAAAAALRLAAIAGLRPAIVMSTLVSTLQPVEIAGAVEGRRFAAEHGMVSIASVETGTVAPILLEPAPSVETA